MQIQLAHLRPDPINARHIADEDVSDLVESMRAQGQLPIIVRDDGDDWLIVAGNRRVAAARELGWQEVDAVELKQHRDDTAALAASAAENMVRRPMHPVDTWRAMTGLMDAGLTLNGAADALGVREHYARRLELLGRMAPDLVNAMSDEKELPQQSYLRTIAMAPHDVQTKALDLNTKKGAVDWYGVCRACERRRLPRTLAIFDHDTAGVQFDEDLFAEPGSDQQFTTLDIKGFLRAQHAALAERAAAFPARVTIATVDEHGSVNVPSGWVRTFDPVPKRWKKKDPRHVFCGVAADGYNIGRVVEVVAAPKPKREAVEVERGADFVDAPPAKAPVTKAVQSELAGIKGEALREGVAAYTKHGPFDMLRLLLLVFTADNLSIQTSTQQYGQHGLHWLANGLIKSDGEADGMFGEDELCAMAADVIAHCIRFDHPNTSFGTSGAAAEWIGRIVGAADFVPRLDTADVLRGFSRDALIEIARSQGIDDTGTAKDLRTRMTGAMPEWRPLVFAAPVPPPNTDALDDLEVGPDSKEFADLDQEDAA